MRIRTTVSLSLSAFILFGVGLSYARKKPQQPPNIILISIDTWRSDYFTPEYMPLLYDYASKNCKIFTNAHSNSTWTKPSHVTMLTGLLQSEHGVEYEGSVIPPTLTMVQNRLKDAGYTTIAFVGGGFVSGEWGFKRGFDTYWQVSPLRKDLKSEKRTFGQTFERSKEPFSEAE
jgi:arylsulfatase A-like enzyme